MADPINLVVGAPAAKRGDGVYSQGRAGAYGDQIVSDLHGKYFEQTSRGNVYSGGTTIAALSANTISLTATTTPILGIYNPSTSGVNAVLLHANLVCVSNNLTSGAGPGVFVWATSVGNTAVSTGSAGWKRGTMVASLSTCKYFALSGGIALTGLTNNVVIAGGTPFPTPGGMTYTTIGSTTLMPAFAGTWDIAGSIIVPPGGVWVVLNTTSCTTFSVAGELVWEEVGA